MSNMDRQSAVWFDGEFGAPAPTVGRREKTAPEFNDTAGRFRERAGGSGDSPESREGKKTMATLKSMFAAASLGAAFMLSNGAQAADLGGYKDEPPVAYNDSIWGPGWAVRVRALGVVPNESSSNWKANGAAFSNGGLSIDNAVVPEVDVSYFFTKNFAAELIVGATSHTITGSNGLASLGKLGDTWALPPTLLGQYHFEIGRGIKPYVGAGLSYAVFFEQGAGSNFRDFKIDDNWGFALQAGIDIPLGNNWFFNVDVKRLWIETKATAWTKGGDKVTADVAVDPWLIGVGVGYKFGGAPAPLK
jgi:outer membrane protein